MPSPEFYFIVYVLLGVNLSSWIVTGMLVVWEFYETSRIPTYAGLASTIRGLISLVAPLIATLIADTGYDSLFIICAILTFLGLLLMRTWVKEPRWQKNNL